MTQTPLNSVDESILHVDDPVEPWSCQFEIRCAGALDPERVGDAVAAAVRRHPLARARLLPSKLTDIGQAWEIADSVPRVPVEIGHCETDAEVAALRARFYSVSPRLDSPPPFSVAVVAHPGGDYLMLNAHHAFGDGVTAYRLMLSILRAYAGLDDPVPDVDPLASRDLIEVIGSESLTERVKRLGELARHIGSHLNPPVPVAPVGGTDLPGYGFHLVRFTADETRAVLERRVDGATVNDVLLAGLAVAVDRWNRDRGAATGRIGLMMPVNLRPAEWRSDVLGNIVSYVTVSLPDEAQESMDVSLPAVAAQTTRFKQADTATAFIEFLRFPSTLVPNALKANMALLAPLTGGTIVATAVLSNLGRQDLPARPADAGDVTELRFSPPGHMPMGTSFGAITVAGELFLTLRYRHAQFDADAAAVFAGIYRKVLLVPDDAHSASPRSIETG